VPHDWWDNIILCIYKNSEHFSGSVLIKHQRLSTQSRLTLDNYWKGKIIEIRQSRISVRQNSISRQSKSNDLVQKTTLAYVQWFYSPSDVVGSHPITEIKRCWPSLKPICKTTDGFSTWGRYVATMAKQELCSSHCEDIIDAATIEGESIQTDCEFNNTYRCI